MRYFLIRIDDSIYLDPLDITDFENICITFDDVDAFNE